MSSAICFNLDQSKKLSSGDGLIDHDAFESDWLWKNIRLQEVAITTLEVDILQRI